MRNRYGRKFIVVCAPVAERRGRTFEHKLCAVEERGYVLSSPPQFLVIDKILYGTVLMVKKSKA